jgi:hypothetical protein
MTKQPGPRHEQKPEPPKPRLMLWAVPKDWATLSEAERSAFADQIYADLTDDGKRRQK